MNYLIEVITIDGHTLLQCEQDIPIEKWDIIRDTWLTFVENRTECGQECVHEVYGMRFVDKRDNYVI